MITGIMACFTKKEMPLLRAFSKYMQLSVAKQEFF